MAAYVTPTSNLRVTIRPERARWSGPGGDYKEIYQTRIVAQFRPGQLTEHQIAEAKKRWPKHRGLATGRPIEERFAVYDTEIAQLEEGWDDETREFVEHRLETLRGRLGNDYIRVDPPKAPLPWPNYGKLKGPNGIKKILATVEEMGIDPWVVIGFEQQNEKREEILVAMQALTEQPAEDPELVEA